MILKWAGKDKKNGDRRLRDQQKNSRNDGMVEKWEARYGILDSGYWILFKAEERRPERRG
jgi:hypothetical protein